MLFLLSGILIPDFPMANSLLHFLLCLFQITSVVRLFWTILLKIGAIFYSFSLLCFFLLLIMFVPNIILCICFYNCLSASRVLTPWELGLCLFHCCFRSNQSNAQYTVSIQYLLCELIYGI